MHTHYTALCCQFLRVRWQLEAVPVLLGISVRGNNLTANDPYDMESWTNAVTFSSAQVEFRLKCGRRAGPRLQLFSRFLISAFVSLCLSTLI